MQDIEAPQFYDEQNIETLVHELHRAGLYNLSQLVMEQFQKIKDLEIEMEEAVEEANDQSYDSGYEDGVNAANHDRENSENSENKKANEFAHWYLTRFEPHDQKKIRTKKINDTYFYIMTEDSYIELKNQFHKMCD